jgi:hypothetical protein
MKDSYLKLLVFTFLLLNISGFTSLGIAVIAITGFIGYLLITIKLKTTLSIYSKKEIIPIILICAIYVLYQQRLTVWEFNRPSNIKVVIYTAQNIVLLYILSLYARRNFIKYITLIRLFALTLFLSFGFFVIGHIFPATAHQLWFTLYEGHVMELEAQGLNVLSQFSGLSSARYIFGYQLAGGVMLLLSLFILDYHKGWKYFWAFALLTGVIAMIIAGERSVVPAILGGIVILSRYMFVGKLKIRRLLPSLYIILTLLITLTSLFIILTDFEINSERIFVLDASGQSPKFLHDRLKSGTDVGLRLGMQIASIKIILDKPLGLFSEGLTEEAWARLAYNKGYDVVSDSDNRTPALVHNGYLRLIMYFGWILGLAILYVLVFIANNFKYLIVKKSSEDNPESLDRNFGVAMASTLFALLVQAMFHNSSLFIFEKTTWIAFCLFLIWNREFRRISNVSNGKTSNI